MHYGNFFLKQGSQNVTRFVTCMCYTYTINNRRRGEHRMQRDVRGNEYRTALVCVDDRRDGRFSGRLYHPFWDGEVTFGSVMEFLLKMEGLLDQMRFPQSFTAKRAFTEPAEQETVPRPPAETRQEGAEATFYLRVMFRQNASWQGTVKWAETGQEESFRSVLELLLMMDSAMSGEAPELPRPPGRPFGSRNGAEA